MDSKKCQKRRRREYDSSLKTFNNQNSNKFVTQMMQNVQFWEGKGRVGKHYYASCSSSLPILNPLIYNCCLQMPNAIVNFAAVTGAVFIIHSGLM